MLLKECPMDELIHTIKTLEHTDISKQIKNKLDTFSQLKQQHPQLIFQELCYCILTANCPAKRCILLQDHLAEDFLTTSTDVLSKKLKQYGYRFPNTRAEYITTSRVHLNTLKHILDTYERDEKRHWFVKNIKGFGYKESSHFLRNIGYFDYAIVDTHIVDLLITHNVIGPAKTITNKKYLHIEKILQEIAENLQMSLGELDLYLWYMETGAILK